MTLPRVLVLSRSFPNPVIPALGIWVARLVDTARSLADQTVVAPVPWVPPFVPLPEGYARFRGLPESDRGPGGVPVLFPRVPTPPGHRLQLLEPLLFLPALAGLVRRLHRERPIDLIHAHFIFPEGVIAARIGRSLGIPVITTEHAHWLPWLQQRAMVRRQVLAALPDIRLITTVSEAVRQGVARIAGDRVETDLLPNVLNDDVFRPEPTESPAGDAERLLFVGAIRRVKGFDVLVRALAALVRRGRDVRLVVVGEPFFAAYVRDAEAAFGLARDLGVEDRIERRGALSEPEVAREMRRAHVLVVPSRRESFSAVSMEAIACGTPVVATRCGGPEEILDGSSGVLVEPEDPEGLADGIEEVLRNRTRYDAARMSAAVISRFGRAAVRDTIGRIYDRVIG